MGPWEKPYFCASFEFETSAVDTIVQELNNA